MGWPPNLRRVTTVHVDQQAVTDELVSTWIASTVGQITASP